MIKDTSREFIGDVNKDLVKRFTKAGVYYTSKIRGLLNTGQPYRKDGLKLVGLSPSVPGGFPKKLSGQLQRSITWTLDKRKFVLTVGSNLKGYPGFLQSGTKLMKPRPWLSKSFDQERGTILKILTGK